MFSAPPLTPVVKKLIITLFAAFVLELLLQNFAQLDVASLLAFTPSELRPSTLHQLFTYVLIGERDSLWLLVNLLFMWLIMSPFESAFGRRHTLELIGAGILGGSLAALLASFILPSTGDRLVGSNTIAYAGMAAMTQVMGSRKMMFFGVVPMTARQLLLVLAGFALLHYLQTKQHLYLASSLGALAAGVGYVKYMARAPRPSAPKRPRNTRFRVLRGGGGRGGGDDDSDRPKWLN
ncbi:MAG: rhomboid family intramembrane serine protease [Polyangiales bacterium]